MPTQCGIDEAGRGPIIGPIVICGVLVDETDIARLKEMGVKDSKLLTPRKRESLAKEIESIAKGIKTVMIPPVEVDAAVDGNHINLNWLEALTSAEIINILNPETAILDCPSPNTTAYKSYVRERLTKKDTRLIVEHKADVNHPSVAAASIIAKVCRDAEIESIKKHVGVDFGSGYMADERTVRFLKQYWRKHPEIFRHSWAPYKKLIHGNYQQILPNSGAQT